MINDRGWNWILRLKINQLIFIYLVILLFLFTFMNPPSFLFLYSLTLFYSQWHFDDVMMWSDEVVRCGWGCSLLTCPFALGSTPLDSIDVIVDSSPLLAAYSNRATWVSIKYNLYVYVREWYVHNNQSSSERFYIVILISCAKSVMCVLRWVHMGAGCAATLSSSPVTESGSKIQTVSFQFWLRHFDTSVSCSYIHKSQKK